jgi:hypothetical protein
MLRGVGSDTDQIYDVGQSNVIGNFGVQPLESSTPDVRPLVHCRCENDRPKAICSEAQGQDRQHERDQYNCTQAQHHLPGLGDGRATDRRALFFPFSLLKQYRISNQTAPLSECTRMLTGLVDNAALMQLTDRDPAKGD